MPSHTRSERLVRAAFREVSRDEPRVVARTRRKKGAAAARRQKTAIALSKARAAGADIPPRGKRPRGSGEFTAAEIAQGFKRIPL